MVTRGLMEGLGMCIMVVFHITDDWGAWYAPTPRFAVSPITHRMGIDELMLGLLPGRPALRNSCPTLLDCSKGEKGVCHLLLSFLPLPSRIA